MSLFQIKNRWIVFNYDTTYQIGRVCNNTFMTPHTNNNMDESTLRRQMKGLLDVDSRLNEFKNVQDGWLKDGGVAPDHAGLDWLSKTITDLPLPYTYLMANGGVSLEWSFGAKDITLEVDIKTHKGEWYVYDSTSKSISDVISLDLTTHDGWSWVLKRLQTLMDDKITSAFNHNVNCISSPPHSEPAARDCDQPKPDY